MKKIKVRGEERAKSRNEVLTTYGVEQLKAQIHDMENFLRVESMSSHFYGGIDPRRRQEMADGGMVAEDRGAVANLSERFIHRQYPGAAFYSNIFIDDTVKE